MYFFLLQFQKEGLQRIRSSNQSRDFEWTSEIMSEPSTEADLSIRLQLPAISDARAPPPDLAEALRIGWGH